MIAQYDTRRGDLPLFRKQSRDELATDEQLSTSSKVTRADADYACPNVDERIARIPQLQNHHLRGGHFDRKERNAVRRDITSMDRHEVVRLGESIAIERRDRQRREIGRAGRTALIAGLDSLAGKELLEDRLEFLIVYALGGFHATALDARTAIGYVAEFLEEEALHIRATAQKNTTSRVARQAARRVAVSAHEKPPTVPGHRWWFF